MLLLPLLLAGVCRLAAQLRRHVGAVDAGAAATRVAPFPPLMRRLVTGVRHGQHAELRAALAVGCSMSMLLVWVGGLCQDADYGLHAVVCVDKGWVRFSQHCKVMLACKRAARIHSLVVQPDIRAQVLKQWVMQLPASHVSITCWVRQCLCA